MCVGRAQYLGDTFGQAAQACLNAAQLQLGQGPPEGIPQQHAGGARLYHHVQARCLQPDVLSPDWCRRQGNQGKVETRGIVVSNKMTQCGSQQQHTLSYNSNHSLQATMLWRAKIFLVMLVPN